MRITPRRSRATSVLCGAASDGPRAGGVEGALSDGVDPRSVESLAPDTDGRPPPASPVSIESTRRGPFVPKVTAVVACANRYVVTPLGLPANGVACVATTSSPYVVRPPAPSLRDS